MNKDLLEEITNYAESCALKDDIDDRCFCAAFQGILKGFQLSKKYSKEEIDEFLKEISKRNH